MFSHDLGFTVIAQLNDYILIILHTLVEGLLSRNTFIKPQLS